MPPPSPVSPVEAAQKRHYDEIGTAYEEAYGDRWSTAYRERFINGPMLAGIELGGKRVLEAMCGSGQTTGTLLRRGALVTGLDLSERMIESFRMRWPQCEIVRASVLETHLPTESFDAVVIVGGLHHVHPHVSAAVREMHRVLRPGGSFCFMEPHTASWQDRARRFWYRRDPLFEKNEAAIDVDALRAEFADRFAVEVERYVGTIAYHLVLNSLVYRVPRWAKRLYSHPLIAAERVLPFLETRRTGAVAVCRWRRLP